MFHMCTHNMLFDNYIEGGWMGWHSEGASLRCLFILLMWEVIYSTGECGNVFISPYQVVPLDFHHPDIFIRQR